MEERPHQGDRAPEGVPWARIVKASHAELRFHIARLRLTAQQERDLWEYVPFNVAGRWHTFEPARTGTKFRTWIARMVGYAILDWMRAQQRRRAVRLAEGDLDDRADRREPPPDAPALRSEVIAAVRACLERLTASQRERLLAAERGREDGVTLAEVAGGFAISLESLKDSLRAARAKMAACLRAKGFGFDHPRDDRGAQ